MFNISIATLFVVLGLWTFLAAPVTARHFGWDTALWCATLLYAACELLAIFLPSVERMLGFANFVIGGLFCLGLVATTYRELTQPTEYWIVLPVYWVVSVGIISYLFACAWIRLRLRNSTSNATV